MPSVEDSDSGSAAHRGDIRAFESEVARESVRRALFGRAMPRAVGRYRIERRCGRGAMGAVFEAHDPELERPVALKLLERRGASTDALERLERQVLHEARAMARLHHPAVAAVYEVGRHGSLVFLAMELMKGASLREWLHREQPAWRRIVAAFCEVGSGLAAAHDAGLAHGDFKPDNLRFDDTGRLRILDFGLARSISAAVPATAVRASSSSAALLLSTGIEGFGGTPAYAAPERLDGDAADERSDQFSFFVSLYESLYGRRPYGGVSLEELRRSIARGPSKPRPPIPGPKSLRAVIERGLAEDPARRFGTMTEAVAALEAIVARRPLRWWLVGGLTLTAGVGGWALARADEPCPDPGSLVASAWGDARSAVAMARPEGLADAPAWPKLERALDDYARGWAEAVASVCRSGEMKEHPERGARHLVCLQQRRAAFEHLLQRLRRGGERTWSSALEAVADLPRVDACDGAELPGVSPPPREIEREVDEIREAIIVARVDADGGDLEKALESIRELGTRAQSLGYAPLLAEVWTAEGKLLTDLDHLEEASERLRAAHGAALSSHHVQVAKQSAIALVYTDGYQRARHELGHHWAWVARQFLREGEPEPSSLVANEAAVLFEEGRLQEADEGFKKAIALESAMPRPDPFVLDSLRHNRGTVAVRLLNFEAAVEIHGEVLESRRRIYGDDHPKVAKALSSLAGAERGLGRLEDAMAHDLEALRRLERIHGSQSPALRLSLLSLGQVQLASGQTDRAIDTFRRLITILEQQVEPTHPWIVSATQQLALAELQRCGYDEAARHFDTVLAGLSQRPDQPHLLAMARHNVAELHLWQGRYDEVRKLTLAAEEYWVEQGRELEQSYPRTARGIAAVEQGAYGEGFEILRRELEVRERLTGTGSTMTAEAAAGLGRALVGLGQVDEGIEALRRALEIYDREDPQGADRGARMRAAEWLAIGLETTHGRNAPEVRALLDDARRFWVACGDDRAAARVEARLRHN